MNQERVNKDASINIVSTTLYGNSGARRGDDSRLEELQATNQVKLAKSTNNAVAHWCINSCGVRSRGRCLSFIENRH
ncbi:hypothetical protein J6590_059446, partial [Homalodisca vitripennis]